MSRVRRYDHKTREKICRRLARGESMRSICADPAMPCWESVRRWLRTRPSFRAAYAQAREDQADWLAAEALDVARQVTPATATMTRVLLAELHWQAARLKPKVYGERPPLPADGPAQDELAEELRTALARAARGPVGMDGGRGGEGAGDADIPDSSDSSGDDTAADGLPEEDDRPAEDAAA